MVVVRLGEHPLEGPNFAVQVRSIRWATLPKLLSYYLPHTLGFKLITLWVLGLGSLQR